LQKYEREQWSLETEKGKGGSRKKLRLLGTGKDAGVRGRRRGRE
jgi:hypothetical protein